MTSLSSKLLLFFTLTIVIVGSAQNGTELLWQPSTQINIKTASRWSYNFGSEYRNTITQSVSNAPLEFTSKHLQFSHNTSYEVGFYAKVSAGIMYRFRDIFEDDKANELRFTQLYNYAKFYNALRLGHRIRADQRLFRDETIFRFRYRFALDVPLNGLELDLHEFYTLASIEALSSFGEEIAPEIDQRFNLGLGYQLFKDTKLQVELEYRFEDYFNATQHRLFVNTSLSYSL